MARRKHTHYDVDFANLLHACCMLHELWCHFLHSFDVSILSWLTEAYQREEIVNECIRHMIHHSMAQLRMQMF